VKHCVFHFLFPPDEQSSESIHPRMGSLYYPSSCSITRNFLFLFDFFSTTANMRCVTIFLHQFPDIGIVIAFVHTDILFHLFRRGSFYNYSFECPFHEFLSCRLAPSTVTERGIPFPSVSKLLFVPLLPRSVGLRPVPSPPKGAFVMAPSIDCHFQSIPFLFSCSINPSSHIFSNTPASRHSSIMHCTGCTLQDLGRAFH